ncbi:MAG: tetratricopeptide repeat protein [Polyangiales bacterium]
MNEPAPELRPFALALALAVALAAPRAEANPDAWRRSYALESRGDPRGALAALEGVGAQGARGYLYELRRAWLLYQSGRYDDAVTAYEQAATSSRGAIEPRVGELLPLLALRRWRDAERVARDVLRVDAGNYLASRRLALALYNLGRFDAARTAYQGVLARYPGDLEMLSGVGWCELRLGRRDQAAAAFRAVLAVSPDDATATAGLSAAAAR